jgi:hypothetical protein
VESLQHASVRKRWSPLCTGGVIKTVFIDFIECNYATINIDYILYKYRVQLCTIFMECNYAHMLSWRAAESHAFAFEAAHG